MSAKIDRDLKEWIDQAAEDQETSQGWVIRQLLKAGREAMERREGDSNPARSAHLHRPKKPSEAPAASVA